MIDVLNKLSLKPFAKSVSEISCCHWSTLVIAEQMLNSKPVKSISFANYMNKKSSTNSPGPDSPGLDQLDLESKEELYPSEDSSVKFGLNEIKNNDTDKNDTKNDSIDESTEEMPEWLKKGIVCLYMYTCTK